MLSTIVLILSPKAGFLEVDIVHRPVAGVLVTEVVIQGFPDDGHE